MTQHAGAGPGCRAKPSAQCGTRETVSGDDQLAVGTWLRGD